MGLLRSKAPNPFRKCGCSAFIVSAPQKQCSLASSVILNVFSSIKALFSPVKSQSGISHCHKKACLNITLCNELKSEQREWKGRRGHISVPTYEGHNTFKLESFPSRMGAEVIETPYQSIYYGGVLVASMVFSPLACCHLGQNLKWAKM